MPFIGTGDLSARLLWLTRAHVAPSPLLEALGDLLDAADGVRLVVTEGACDIIRLALLTGASLTLGTGRATVSQGLVIETALFKTMLETGCVTVELSLPVGRLVHRQVVVTPFSGERVQLVETVERVTRRDLLVIGGIDGGKGHQAEDLHVCLKTKSVQK